VLSGREAQAPRSHGEVTLAIRRAPLQGSDAPAEARRFQAPDLRYLAAYLETLIVLTTLVTPETWRATSFALSPTCPWVTVPVK
jgi:hypothetical protein